MEAEFESPLNIPKFGTTTEKYPTYEYREARKLYYDEIYSKEDTSPRQKAHCRLHGRIWSHYWRARIALEDSPTKKEYVSKLKKIRGKKYYLGYRLDIDHYTNHWLWANGDREGPEVLAWIYDPIKGDFSRYKNNEYKLWFDPPYYSEQSKYLSKGASLYVF